MAVKHRLDELPKRNRKAAIEDAGYRKLTKAEAKKLGTSDRNYTSQKAGVKRLDKTKVRGRRSLEQEVLGIQYERAATENRARRGNRSPLDRHARYLESFRAQFPGMSRAQARQDPRFKKAYRKAVNSKGSGMHAKDKTRAEKRATMNRLEGLKELGLFDEEKFAELFEGYVGE